MFLDDTRLFKHGDGRKDSNFDFLVELNFRATCSLFAVLVHVKTDIFVCLHKKIS